LRKNNLSILLIVVFISTFFILITLNEDYNSISSIDIQGNSSNFTFLKDEITNSYHEKEEISPMFIQSDSSSNRPEVVEVSSKSINVLENLISSIISIESSHTSGDTIKRSLIAQVNNAILILKDDDSDNDNIICNNFVNKFISSVKLYERIGLFQPSSSGKISQDILTLKNSLCGSNR
jgi:hypothetical protein